MSNALLPFSFVLAPSSSRRCCCCCCCCCCSLASSTPSSSSRLCASERFLCSHHRVCFSFLAFARRPREKTTATTPSTPTTTTTPRRRRRRRRRRASQSDVFLTTTSGFFRIKILLKFRYSKRLWREKKESQNALDNKKHILTERDGEISRAGHPKTDTEERRKPRCDTNNNDPSSSDHHRERRRVEKMVPLARADLSLVKRDVFFRAKKTVASEERQYSRKGDERSPRRRGCRRRRS